AKVFKSIMDDEQSARGEPPRRRICGRLLRETTDDHLEILARPPLSFLDPHKPLPKISRHLSSARGPLAGAPVPPFQSPSVWLPIPLPLPQPHRGRVHPNPSPRSLWPRP